MYLFNNIRDIDSTHFITRPIVKYKANKILKIHSKHIGRHCDR